MTLSNRLLASAAVVVALACAPAAADAGSVSVEEVPGEVNQAVLRFSAAAGETNLVTVTPAKPGVPPIPPTGDVEVEVRDAGAPLSPGAGCTTATGGSAFCTLHGPRYSEYEYCGHDCQRELPGTAWQDAMRIELGDGTDSFDGSAFAGRDYLEQWPMTVTGGSGNDTIATGSGKDLITPGPGDDTVRPGNGTNYVIADPQPDGNDRLEFAAPSESRNLVDDSARTEPLHLADHVLGAAGEEDTISGPAEVLGGSGNDEFISAGEWLKGGPGDDTLTGSPGDDYIFGGPGDDTIRGEAGDDRLYGGEGDDTIEGGSGDDTIEEREEKPGDNLLLETQIPPSTGNDKLLGGPGQDFILAGLGNDLVEGGPGDDKLYGEAGDDTLEGGTGNDIVAGEEGDDVMRGGKGDDELLGDFNDEQLGGGESGQGVDIGIDRLDCGPGADFGEANPWDQVENCERRRTVRAVTVEKIAHDRADGTAKVFFSIYSTYYSKSGARLHVGGVEVKPVVYSQPRSESVIQGIPLVIRATGRKLAALKESGHVRLKLRFVWEPTRGQNAIETRSVGLVLKKPGKPGPVSGR